MSYVYTYDEKTTGYFANYASAYTDAPFSTTTPFTLSRATPAYGLLTATGYSADSDAYSMGYLLDGTYTVSAYSSYWFYGSGYVYSVTPSVSIYNSVGTPITNNYYGSVSFNVTAPGTYYAVVTGSTYQSSQYSLSYSYILPINYTATSNLSISGGNSAGSTVSVVGNYYDANGVTTATPAITWFIDSNIVSTNSTYTIQPADAGKVLVAVVQIYDDAGYLDTFGPPAVLI